MACRLVSAFIIWTIGGMMLMEPLGTNFNEILIEVDKMSFKKMHFL